MPDLVLLRVGACSLYYHASIVHDDVAFYCHCDAFFSECSFASDANGCSCLLWLFFQRINCHCLCYCRANCKVHLLADAMWVAQQRCWGLLENTSSYKPVAAAAGISCCIRWCLQGAFHVMPSTSTLTPSHAFCTAQSQSRA